MLLSVLGMSGALPPSVTRQEILGNSLAACSLAGHNNNRKIHFQVAEHLLSLLRRRVVFHIDFRAHSINSGREGAS
jgi:hypothetical protein